MEPLQVFLRLGIAALLGCLIGFNRELSGKPAGMRTHGLVALGAAVIIVASFGIAGLDHAAVLRTIQGIMAGIGFLGGGVILRDESRQSIYGLTTAASIWVVCVIGIACGAGQWLASAIGTFFTLILLILGEKLEEKLRLKRGPGPAEAGEGRKPLV